MGTLEVLKVHWGLSGESKITGSCFQQSNLALIQTGILQTTGKLTSKRALVTTNTHTIYSLELKFYSQKCIKIKGTYHFDTVCTIWGESTVITSWNSNSNKGDCPHNRKAQEISLSSHNAVLQYHFSVCCSYLVQHESLIVKHLKSSNVRMFCALSQNYRHL